MQRVRIPVAICLLLAACQPHGPIAELRLGWVLHMDDLEHLEEVFVQQGFKPELQQYLSEQNASESGKPWRYKYDGVVYSYLDYPSRDEKHLRAVLYLKGNSGRLRIAIHGRNACPNKGFLKEDQDVLDQLELRIGERFKREVRFKLDASQRC